MLVIFNGMLEAGMWFVFAVLNILFSCWKDDMRRAGPSSTFDMDKLKSTIKQFVRDWSQAGKAERDSCYAPIIEEIQKQFPPEKWCVCDFIYANMALPVSSRYNTCHDT